MTLRLKLQCFLLLLTASTHMAAAVDENLPTTISVKSLLGRWRSGDTNALNCIVEFSKERAVISTFRGDKHLSNVNSWYRVHPREGKVTLGINGEASLSRDGELKLKLTRDFPHIAVLREATLRRMPDIKKDSP